MPHTSYEGPRHGDYVRYVDELLRASPLYRSASGWTGQGPGDFTDAMATPGAQAQSVAGRVREQVLAAAGKARAAAQQAPASAAREPAARASAAKAGAKARTKAGRKPGFRLGPGSVLGIAAGMLLSALIPGVGALILLLTVVHAIFKGFRSGLHASR
ncbi:hypothetical protein [Delftia sp. PS-11]|uniref:hypothetical protein n=1 Tax=Delftia sp. PS-11 TaxID=2767222 RepID=UPI0024590F0B|nr:hypothetical protein [Delftia sp. PS-11]KAJ8745129.1 hypothetical protein H9T68_08725 [Delftia sp. PS-11]